MTTNPEKQTSLITALELLVVSAALVAAACSSSSSPNGDGDTGGKANDAGTAGQAASLSSGGASAGAGTKGTSGSGGPASSGSGGAAGVAGVEGRAGAGAVGVGGANGQAGVGGASGQAGSAGGASEQAGVGGASGQAGSAGGLGQAGAVGTGGGAYHPCPTDGSACKIMPLGDSITFGVNDLGNGGYRGPLFASAVAAGRKITFTGSLSNGPTSVSGQVFPQKNEGHSGWGISEVNPNSGGNAGIATVIPSPAFKSNSGGIPDIILLHIGTNDQGSLSATQMTTDLSGLLDKIISNAPNAYLVVAQIIPVGYGNNAVIKSYNQSIPGPVQQRANAGKHITIVDMFTLFAPSTMLGSDNIHPSSAGYKFMADHWYSVVGSLLPQ